LISRRVDILYCLYILACLPACTLMSLTNELTANVGKAAACEVKWAT
jgi:hypothetical protein